MNLKSGAATVLITASLTASAVTLPEYKPVSGVTGTIKAIGSDTMNNEMALWSESFRRHYPGVTIEVDGKGSSTAPAALIEGTASFGPMSRPMKDSEKQNFREKFGYDPTEVRTSIDMLSVFVHRDNPIKELSLKQIDGIFSQTLKSGSTSIKTWGDLGLTGEWAKKPIQLYGRNSASGTYGYFKEHALFKGDFTSAVKELPGSSAVVQAVGTDKYGIGYSGFGYLNSGVKALAVAGTSGKAVEPSVEAAVEGNYPLARFLYLYVNKAPKQPLDPLRREFLRFVLSAAGQEEVKKDGYIPLSAKMIETERKSLNITE